jgi:hypothetical protein
MNHTILWETFLQLQSSNLPYNVVESHIHRKWLLLIVSLDTAPGGYQSAGWSASVAKKRSNTAERQCNAWTLCIEAWLEPMNCFAFLNELDNDLMKRATRQGISATLLRGATLSSSWVTLSRAVDFIFIKVHIH